MSSDPLVTAYLNVVDSIEERDDDVARALLIGQGFPAQDVARAINFVRVAFGRALLDSVALGCRFSRRFYVLDAEGSVLEDGDLDDDAIYRAACAAVPLHEHLLSVLGLRSAEVAVISDALNCGSEPSDLEGAPVVLFADTPTETGVACAHALIRSLLGEELGEESPAPDSARYLALTSATERSAVRHRNDF